ncbi:hypothetical protein GCM10010975_26780 [Comamonas phosphati]|nr:hypothetical protein GCM10010975_26780 [Comamonas phosphati]
MRAGIDYIPAVDNERRFWPIGMVEPEDLPPSNTPSFGDVLLPFVEELDHPHNTQPNHLWLGNRNTNDVFLTRHQDEGELQVYPNRAGKWAGHMIRRDSSNHQWHRTVLCVVDNFGWLVEVPAC